MKSISLLSDEDIIEVVSRYKFYHIIPINERISTPGVPEFTNIHEPIFRQMNKIDFAGKSVLDIGCRDGLFSFMAEKAGASRILGIDNCLSLGAVEFLIPYFQSKVQMIEKGLYDLDLKFDGAFDVILFLGVLYHLRYHFQALKIISNITKDGGTLLLETAIYADSGDKAILFCPIEDESPYEPTSVTFFNQKGIIDTLKTFGFIVDEVDYSSRAKVEKNDYTILRATFRCHKNAALLQHFPHQYWQGYQHKGWQNQDPIIK